MVTGGAALSASQFPLNELSASQDTGRKRKDSGSRPPNVVIINADDLGYGDLGCYGGSVIKTPHIDSLAASGVRFTDFHACDSVCTPSRAGLLTGRYPVRMGLDTPLQSENMSFKDSAILQFGYTMGKAGIIDVATDGEASGLDQNEITIAEALKKAGYRTGMVGKWHLGDYAENPAHHPFRHGFDTYFGVPHSNDMTPFPLFDGEQQLEAQIEDQSKLTGLYTREALRFLESTGDNPFFLYFAHTFPHRPLFASDRFRNKSEGGRFGDTVEEIDWSVGEILSALQQHGLAENTLLIFTSDNGPWYQGSPGTFRGRKGQSYEGGHRVPFLASWPAVVKPGSTCDAAASNIDLFPTILTIADIPIPTDRIIDGRSILHLLTGEERQTPHEAFYYYHHGILEGIRMGKWKYIRSINHYTWPAPVNKTLGFLSVFTTGPLPLLFNLENDHGESYNVIDKYPEVGQRLLGQLEQWEQEISDNRSGML